MIEGCPEAFTSWDIKTAYLYLLEHQRDDGAIPDRVDKESFPIFLVVGDNPPTDIPQFLVKILSEYQKLTKDTSLFLDTAEYLVKAMRSVPRSIWGLVHIDPIQIHSPYGFTDTIGKTGNLLFSSLLYYEAASLLAEMSAETGREDIEQAYSAEADQVKESLESLWDDSSNLFLAASGDCRQPDIWGSAYAVYIGATTEEQRERICHFFMENYDKVVMEGQVRHLIAGTYWEKIIHPAAKKEEYQNGAYWAVPTGWVSYCLRQEEGLADKILEDMIESFQKRGIYECINTNYYKLKDYVASATLPLKEINRVEGVKSILKTDKT